MHGDRYALSRGCDERYRRGTVRWKRNAALSITDVQPSADEQLRHRKRVYSVIMAIHIVGFAIGGSLYERAWLTGLIIIIVTGPLQWVAVLIANAAPRLRDNRRARTPP
jgi:Protein of unknown function (DUF3099)